MDRVCLLVVLAACLTGLIGRTVGEVEPTEEICPFDLATFLDNATSSYWDDAENWVQGEVPDKTTDVVLDEDAFTELDSSARISSLAIKSGAKLLISSGSLRVIRTAITCFNVNYCSGHGTCVEEDTCVCDNGWLGADCSEDASLEHSKRSHLQQFISERQTTRFTRS